MIEHLMQIAADRQMGFLHERGLPIGVDGDHVLTPGHPFEVVRGPADPASDVQFGRDSFARLTDLPLVFDPAEIDDHAAGGHTGSQ